MSIDYIRDYNIICENKLRQFNYVCSPSDEPALVWMNYKARSILPYPRIVHIPYYFSYPLQFNTAINDLFNDVILGMPIKKYQSKQINNPSALDAMLFDWNIHHFHLRKSQIGLFDVERTENLLFAIVMPLDFYCLAVGKHGDWCDKRLLNIALENWPYLLAPYRIKGNVGTFPTSDDYKKLRKACINNIISLSDGNCYFPLGGGLTTNGFSQKVVLDYLQIQRVLNGIQERSQSIDFLQKVESVSQISIQKPNWILKDISFASLMYTLYDPQLNLMVDVTHEP